MFKRSLSTLNSCGRRLLSVQQADGYDWAKLEKLLMEPFEYAQKLPCKHHTLMAPAFNHWLQVPEKEIKGIQKASRAWVTWSILVVVSFGFYTDDKWIKAVTFGKDLMEVESSSTVFIWRSMCCSLDDIQDDSKFRYGMPAAHRVFGVGITINAANEALLLVQKQITELGHPLAPKIFMKRVEEYLRGQGIDIYWQDKNICPPEEIHIEMTKKKAGAYFVLPVELMQLFSSNKTNYTDLAIKIGSYYELLDDYYNLLHPKALPRLANKKQENHGINSDITEGKITLAIIHASQFPDVATELADILKQRTSDPLLQNRVISLLKKHGSDEYVRDKLIKMESDIRAQIDQLGGNPVLTAYMDDLSFQNYELEHDKELYS